MATESERRSSSAVSDMGAWAMNVISSVGIIMVNKQLMSSSGFAFSFATTLTGFHFALTALVGLVSNATGFSASKHVPMWELIWFSIVANVSIAAMNFSLMLNSVGFYQRRFVYDLLFMYWFSDLRSRFCIGITRFTNKSHIARAVLESMCFQVKDVLDSMNKDAGEKGSLSNDKGGEFLLRVDGGATANNLLMQIQADLMGTPVVRPLDIETTALGAAYAAGLAVGFWKEGDIFESGEKAKNSKTFRPNMDEAHT